MVVVIGADVHKATHTLVAVDEVGKVLGQGVFQARREGHLKALGWARRSFKDTELVWAIEDCRHLNHATSPHDATSFTLRDSTITFYEDRPFPPDTVRALGRAGGGARRDVARPKSRAVDL